MAKPKTVRIEQIQLFATCLREMATACEKSIKKLEEQKRTETTAANFKSAVDKGLEHCLRFASTVAGSVETQEAEVIFDKLLSEVTAPSSEDAVESEITKTKRQRTAESATGSTKPRTQDKRRP